MLSIIAATVTGSVVFGAGELIDIIRSALGGAPLPAGIPAGRAGIIVNLRLPRVLLAWIAGAGLSASGAIMQSVLKNPLASSFTLGVSAGASFGAGLVILGSAAIPALAFIPQIASVPLAGFLFSLLSIVVVLRFSSAIDSRLDNTTIILSGMIFSLFINALLTLLSALARQEMNRLVLWQMGSFALKGWQPVMLLFPLVGAGCVIAALFGRQLDILTFGDDEAVSMGVAAPAAKSALIALASVITGCIVSFTGVIGFVDLAVPHLVRRLAGPAHRRLIPLSALTGGAFMVCADLVSRTALPPLDIPVGAITAILGAPLFAWIFFTSGKQKA